MLKAIRVSVMLLALVGSVHAGEVLTPPAPQPPPATAQNTDSNTATTNSLIQTVVAVIASILP